VTTYSCDANTRLTGRLYPDGSRHTFAYDEVGTFDAAGNQQIEQAPGGTTTNVWDYENMRTAVLLPNGTRQTMTYNADLRQHLREV
jgi:YD repeat-containing protein